MVILKISKNIKFIVIVNQNKFGISTSGNNKFVSWTNKIKNHIKISKSKKSIRFIIFQAF